MIIANDRNNNLKKKLQKLIPNSKEVKILVGYCHFSGIKELHGDLSIVLCLITEFPVQYLQNFI